MLAAGIVRSGPDLPPSYPSYHDSGIPLPPPVHQTTPAERPTNGSMTAQPDRVWIARGWPPVEHRHARAGLAVLARLEALDKATKALAAELSLDRVLPRIVALKDWANA